MAAPATATTARDPVNPRARPRSPAKIGLVLAGLLVFFLVSTFAPQPIPQHFTVLALSVVVGSCVIGKVAHALHEGLGERSK